MEKRLIALFFFVLTSFPVIAGKNPADCTTPTELDQHVEAIMDITSVNGGCSDPEKLKGICDYVSNKKEASADSPFEYVYEEKIYQAACANPSDSEEVVVKKINPDGRGVLIPGGGLGPVH